MAEKETVVTHTYDLLKYIVPQLLKFPRAQKFVLADKIQQNLTYILELLIEAYARKAQRGKRFQPNVADFNFHLEGNLFQLQQELQEQSYRPGEYNTFHILDPKPRMISAAPYRDRVVHHALCNVIEPILERSMIYDTYANRKGKGTRAGIRRCQAYMRQYGYVLKADIRKCFPSIDHAILKS